MGRSPPARGAVGMIEQTFPEDAPIAVRLREMAELVEVVGLSESCMAFDVEREQAECELIGTLREAADELDGAA
jgi:hypothetical protein